jgi:PAS domain S-box-containing protein
MDRQIRILVLDDRCEDVELLQRELRKAGLAVDLNWAPDKKAFLHALAGQAPDAFFADYSVPGFDGLEAIRLARERFPDMPVIMVSGVIGEDAAIESLKAGATDYVLKQRLSRVGPVLKRALREAEQATDSRQAQRELAAAVQLLRLVNESTDTRDLCRAATAFFHEQSGCEAVGIRLRSGDDYPYFEQRGFPPEFVLAESPLCARDRNGNVLRDSSGNPTLDCMCGNVICGRFDATQPFFTAAGSFWTNSTSDLLASTTEADRQARTRNRCNGEGYESVALVPLRFRDERLGLLQLNDRRKGLFSPAAVALWERLAGHLAVALAKLRAEDDLREREKDLRLLMDATPAVIAYVGADCTYRRVNRVYDLWHGRAAQAVLGRPVRAIVGEPAWEAVRPYVEQALAGETVSYERALPIGRDVRWLHTTYTPDRDASGQVQGFAVHSVDIGERKRAEEALRQARDELEARVEERTKELSGTVDTLRSEIARRTLAEEVLSRRTEQLRELASELTLTEQRERRRLAGVLHDGLQQLLVGANYRLETLSRSASPVVRREAAEISGLIRESLDMSRSLTAELGPPLLEEGGLAPALQWLARWVEQRQGLKVRVKAEGHKRLLPEDLTVILFQATRELLFNVAKHAGVRTADVVLRRLQDWIQITVEDDGAGFDPASLRVEGGASGGLGLLGIRERLGFLGGTMEIASSPGKGSLVTLRAPLRDTRDGREPADWARSARTAMAAPCLGARADEGGRIRVVLVDDHVVTRQALAVLLSQEPDIHIVGDASDGESAVSLAVQVRPDVVLMDVNMPGLDGIQATRAIHEQLPEVRIIGLSMYEEAERADAMRNAGASDYLTKSGSPDAVLAAIRARGVAPPRQPAARRSSAVKRPSKKPRRRR